jgi:hypothetical protein
MAWTGTLQANPSLSFRRQVSQAMDCRLIASVISLVMQDKLVLGDFGWRAYHSREKYRLVEVRRPVS